MQGKWQKLKSIDLSRIYTAIALLAIVIVIGMMHSFMLLWIFLGIVYLVALLESTRLYLGQFSLLIVLYGICLWLGAWLIQYSLIYTLWIFFVMLMILASFQGFSKKGNTLIVLPMLYPTVSFFMLLASYQDLGIASLFLLISIIGLSDIFALVGGKLFGKHALSLSSPSKTIEGAIIGLCAAVVVGSVFAYVWWVEIRFWEAVILASLTAIAGIFGDLYESYLKRNANVKDSGRILPGHGGILDRVDGYLFAILIFYPLLFLMTRS